MKGKKIGIIIVLFISALCFTNINDASARFPNFSSVYANGFYSSLLGEDTDIFVSVGIDIFENPCGKTVELISNRSEYDTITDVNSKIECNFGKASFKIKSSQTGISTVVAKTEGKIIGSVDISFFDKRTDDILIRPNGHPIVYLIKDGYKYEIKNPSMLYAHGYKWSDVIDIDPVEEHLYELGKDMKMESLINVDNQIYYIYNDLKLSVSQNMIDNSFLNSLEIHNVSDKNLIWELKRMKLLSDEKTKKVYYITEKNKKRHIINETVFSSYNNKWEDVIEVSEELLESYSDVVLVKAIGDYKVYKLENGKKRWIKTAEAFNRLGFSWNEIAPVNSLEISEYFDGDVID